jgi:predicted nucleic acid-binding protein
VECWDTSALLELYVPEPDSPTFVERIGLIGTALLTADVAAVELLCPPVLIRSLDALHVATALSAKVGMVVATDVRLRRAATLAGLETAPQALLR